MPKGVYTRKKNLPAVIEHQIQRSGQFGEYPLDLIPDPRPPTQRTGRNSLEASLLGLCHRMLDQNERLMDMMTPPKKKRGPYKTKRKEKVK